MKTDKQMSQNILCRVNEIKEERRAVKSGILTLAAITCAFALIIASVFSFYFGSSPLTDKNLSATADGARRTGTFLMVASAAYETETLINKDADVVLPLGGILTAKNTNESSFSEKDMIMLELKEKLLNLYGKDCDWHIRGIQEDSTVYFGTADFLKLKVEDSESVDNISISCTENGTLTVRTKSKHDSSLSEYIKTARYGSTITVTGKEYAEIFEKIDGIRIEWFLSDSMVNIFKASPDTPLSKVKDEITVKIDYTDGSTEIYTVSLSFDDNGLLSAKCCF